MENDPYEDFVIQILGDAQDWEHMTIPTREAVARNLAFKLRALIDQHVSTMPVIKVQDATDRFVKD